MWLYIPELDLYIEYQGTWTHGKEPYNPLNEEHVRIVEKWSKKQTDYYKRAIRGWTINDPNKRKYVKEHNLNWIEFFTEKEFEKWYKEL